MKTKTEIVSGLRGVISEFLTMSKIMGREALAAKRKYEAAGPGDYHLELWLRYRAEARLWGKAARKCRQALGS